MASGNFTPLASPDRARVPVPAPIPEPILDIHEIQGNILAGFSKDHQRLLALNIRSVPSARRWLARVLPYINSVAEVYQFNSLYKMRRARLGRDPQSLTVTWMNLAFSHEGIAKLTSPADADALPDDSFRSGLNKERSEFLGDPKPPGETDPTAHWVVGGINRLTDILMIVAGDDRNGLADKVEQLRPGQDDGPDAPEVLWEEQGETRADLPGHEHFGFKDGVSQPGVRGLISKGPRIYLTDRLLKPSAPGTVEFAAPGKPLVWPGHFVLGYPFGDRSDGTPRKATPLSKPWFKNGSFLVFRRLSQNVERFASFVVSESARLASLPGFQGLSPQHLGALLVGRWPSGAPISRAPGADSPGLADDNLANNDFFFTQDTPSPQFQPGAGRLPGMFSSAKEGTNGPVCPHAAHIFKVNPRDNTTDVGPDFDTLTRRILRRGIPFGTPLEDPLKGDDGIERGLHFLCYQASIVEQFEFLQQNWANNSGAPTSGGTDLIIGQTVTMVRAMNIASLSPGQDGQTVTAPIQWVTPTGGGYFFAPSLSAIRDVLARVENTPNRRLV